MSFLTVKLSAVYVYKVSLVLPASPPPTTKSVGSTGEQATVYTAFVAKASYTEVLVAIFHADIPPVKSPKNTYFLSDEKQMPWIFEVLVGCLYWLF